MLQYLAYSFGAISSMNFLDNSPESLKPMVLRVIASYDQILQQWTYFAGKFNKPYWLELLKPIKLQLKRSTKYDLKNVAIKAKIFKGKLYLSVCAKDPKKRFDLNQFKLPLLPNGEKTCKKMRIKHDKGAWVDQKVFVVFSTQSSNALMRKNGTF